MSTTSNVGVNVRPIWPISRPGSLARVRRHRGSATRPSPCRRRSTSRSPVLRPVTDGWLTAAAARVALAALDDHAAVDDASAATAGDLHQQRPNPARYRTRRHHDHPAGSDLVRRVWRWTARLRRASTRTHRKHTPTSGCSPRRTRLACTVRSPQHQQPVVPGGSSESDPIAVSAMPPSLPPWHHRAAGSLCCHPVSRHLPAGRIVRATLRFRPGPCHLRDPHRSVPVQRPCSRSQRARTSGVLGPRRSRVPARPRRMWRDSRVRMQAQLRDRLQRCRRARPLP